MRPEPPRLVAPQCVHEFTGAPPSRAFLIAPQWCFYCGEMLWGGTDNLWECERCEGLCHKRCVPTGERLEVCCPRRRVMRGRARVVYRMPPPQTAAEEAAGGLTDRGMEGPAGYEAAEAQAEETIDFAYPSVVEDPGVDEGRGPVQVSATRLVQLLKDMCRGRSLDGVEWSLVDLALLTRVHHRHYLRHTAAAAPVHDTPLVERLAVAVRHSCACYGSCQRPEIDGRTFDEEAYHEAVHSALAGTAELLRWCWLPDDYCPAWHLAVDRRERFGVLAVRGTLHASDLYIDFNGQPAEFCGGMAHGGIAAAAKALYREVAPVLRRYFHPDEGGEFAGWPVLLTGHSLGGSIAALLCLLLREEGLAAALRVHGLAFGAVPCLSEDLAHAADGMVASVVLGKDLVCRASMVGADNLLAELAFPPGLWGRFEVPAAFAAALVALCAAGLRRRGGSELDIDEHLEEEDSEPEPLEDRILPPPVVRLLLPGEVLLIHVVLGAEYDSEEARYLGSPPPGTALLRRSRAESCVRALLGAGMVSDHRPDNYMDAVDAVWALQSTVGLHAFHRAGAGAVGARLDPGGSVPIRDLAFSAFS
eukprot:Hpha_TRINITY_DN5347_c0_g1::TRINITY_DN5347_c0_g1_i1::g.32899::m.32899/K13806/DAGL; sn1-specific diacylglycerol lipase